MSLTKRFFEDLEVGEEYANINCSIPMLELMKRDYSVQFTLNFIKEKNPSYKDNETLSQLHREKRKISNKILEIEQSINHNKK